MSDTDLEAALSSAGVPNAEGEAILDENEAARIAGLRASLAVLAIVAILALYFTRLLSAEPIVGAKESMPRSSVESPD